MLHTFEKKSQKTTRRDLMIAAERLRELIHTRGVGPVWRRVVDMRARLRPWIEPIEAEHLRIRADLMLEVERLIAARGLTQAEAAKLLQRERDRVDLGPHARQVERFSIDTLVEMLSRAGADVTVKVRRRKHAA